MRLRQIRSRPAQHLVLLLQLPHPLECFGDLTPFVSINGWRCNTVGLEPVVLHPELQRGTGYTHIVTDLALGHPSIHHRHRVALELLRILPRHRQHPSSTTPTESCSQGVNQTNS